MSVLIPGTGRDRTTKEEMDDVALCICRANVMGTAQLEFLSSGIRLPGVRRYSIQHQSIAPRQTPYIIVYIVTMLCHTHTLDTPLRTARATGRTRSMLALLPVDAASVRSPCTPTLFRTFHLAGRRPHPPCIGRLTLRCHPP
jgi:hypothetical protein